MKIVRTKPTSPGRRFVEKIVNPNLAKNNPCSSLVNRLVKRGGRNNSGSITTRRRGGGHIKKYRIIDFKRRKDNIIGRVKSLEYDPNRNANIALIVYLDGEKRYIISPQGLKIKDEIISGERATIKVGNALALVDIPVGTTVHCIELKPGKGAQIARSGGCYAQIIARDGIYAVLKLRSGEVRKVLSACRASIGIVDNSLYNLISRGKAGVNRWRGIRPRVRAVAMNPVDHPMGGGEGKTSGGGHPVSPSGQKAKGLKTRRKSYSDKYILTKRGKKRGR